MWYSVIDLKEFSCSIIKDKRAVAKLVGVSVPTLDKKLNGSGVYLVDRFVVGRSEPVKSGRGRN